MSIDLSLLTPAPWRPWSLAGTPATGGDFAQIIGPKRVQRDRSEGFTQTDAEFIALARNAFDYWYRCAPDEALQWLLDTDIWYRETHRPKVENKPCER